MAQIGNISESLEDYLEVIHHLVAEKRVARVRDIAGRKGVKMSSVVGALRRLSTAGFVVYRARDFVEMTEQGEDLARRLVARHEFLTQFFVDLLGVEPGIAEEEACSVEHVLSPDTVVRLRRLGRYVAGSEQLQERFSALNPSGEEAVEDAPLPDPL